MKEGRRIYILRKSQEEENQKVAKGKREIGNRKKGYRKKGVGKSKALENNRKNNTGGLRQEKSDRRKQL